MVIKASLSYYFKNTHGRIIYLDCVASHTDQCLAETEFRHQIKVEIRPFRDILLGLFFMSIGMLVDVSAWRQTWQWIALLVFALTIGKMVLITIISRLTHRDLSVAIRTGIVLAQGGEFGFALLTLAL